MEILEWGKKLKRQRWGESSQWQIKYFAINGYFKKIKLFPNKNYGINTYFKMMELYPDLWRVLPILPTLTVIEQWSFWSEKWIEILLFTLTYGLFNNRMVFAYSTPNWSSSPSSIVRKWYSIVARFGIFCILKVVEKPN